MKELIIAYLTGKFPFSSELQAFWMAFQGCMAVRNGPNRNKQMNWFHAFMVSVLTGYAGATFASLWVARPTSMLGNDLNMASCIAAFILVNCTPFDIGYKLGNSLPIVLITTMFAQLFRVLGLTKFNDIAFEIFRNQPSEYYPIPVFGPILLATLLGNMGGFFHKGFHDYLKNGMPWAFQNGLFCATFYHFYVNDKTGFIGIALRKYVGGLPGKMGLSEEVFPVVVVSFFMHTMAILQLPQVCGPSFSPFNKGEEVIRKSRSLFIPKGLVQQKEVQRVKSTPKDKKDK